MASFSLTTLIEQSDLSLVGYMEAVGGAKGQLGGCLTRQRAEVLVAVEVRQHYAHPPPLEVPRPGARKVSGWPKRWKLAHAFLWEYR